ncbi:hypothetical protein [Rhodovulum sulfidophilum]|nr:hypothetical protein [Rhodovulum sulfidophilum]MBL3562285.1 hypothetical protein [Rhodovulum sulfidophilum]
MPRHGMRNGTSLRRIPLHGAAGAGRIMGGPARRARRGLWQAHVIA